jgi:hypothetical protein
MNFCFNCGHALSGTENFCPNCGASLRESSNDSFIPPPTSQSTFDEVVFTSSVVLGGSLLRPDKLTITAAEVVYQKRNLNLIGTDTITIPLSRVASVKVDRKLINAEITIYSTGNKEVVVKNFSVGDARKIKSEIERRLS